MTAVVGLMNKRGVAIAADSAVTRTHSHAGRTKQKCTNNGNKMLRMSNVVPVSVMLTGNGAFIWNQWDIVIRQYRRDRGNICHATVEACVHDFFEYIAHNDIFWNEQHMKTWIKGNMSWLINTANDYIPWETKITKNDGTFAKPKGYYNAFIKELKDRQKCFKKDGKCPQFKDYTLEQFKQYSKTYIDECFEGFIKDENEPFKTSFPKDFLDSLKEELEITLLERLTTRWESEDSATLVFSGFGNEQEYPSLVSVNICEGFDHRVNYHIRPEDIICISEENPVAFCPFAQADVTNSIIRGQHKSWLGSIMKNTQNKYQNAAENLFNKKFQEQDFEFLQMLAEVEYDDLIVRYNKNIIRLLDKNQREWEKTLENYDMKSMASLAQSLIELTGFHRILTFEQEGVGGPVDVAVITKNDGFTWLNRKSWYHHKDVNGMYGSMGI